MRFAVLVATATAHRTQRRSPLFPSGCGIASTQAPAVEKTQHLKTLPDSCLHHRSVNSFTLPHLPPLQHTFHTIHASPTPAGEIVARGRGRRARRDERVHVADRRLHGHQQGTGIGGGASAAALLPEGAHVAVQLHGRQHERLDVGRVGQRGVRKCGKCEQQEDEGSVGYKQAWSC